MKPKKLLRYIIILAVLLVILAVVGKKVGWFGKEEFIQVAVEKAETRKIVETITANGKIQPETEVKISPEVSGEIVELHVVEGEFVEQGKLLVRIKPDLYISSKDRAAAALNSSKARLAQAEAQFINSELSYNRNKSLWEQRTISESEYETAQANYQTSKAELEAAKYSVKSAEASLNEAQENLIKTSIYAPMSGTISALMVEKGERVVGTAMMTGTEMMRVSDLTRMEVKVEVNENDIVRVNMYDTANIEVDAFLGETFKGIVTEIANAANTSGLAADQVTNFNVKVFLLQSSYEHLFEQGYKNPFLPGMSATVDIETDIKYDVLAIPIQAVTTRADSIYEELADSLDKKPDEDKDERDVRETVFLVSEDGTVVMREVKTGIQDNNYIQILEGVEVGEEVITAPYSAINKKLDQGSPVEVVDKDELFKPKKKKDRS
ncbi:MAG: efflux RND transporter periplasmic adaptor subunit [Bacteroidales bacterium]|nr:efflux RND transporter periplasmic adaptor subunit [Bacteroidales bacterium]